MDGTRIPYLDWLRWLAVLAVVAFHAVLPFASIPWLIRNAERIDLIALAAMLLEFAFPIFFLIAGAGTRLALRTMSIRTFLAERMTRLLIPFVVGTLVLTPLTGYVIALHDGTAGESFLAFLVAYPGLAFERNVLGAGFSPLVFQGAMHLWFLGWLFVFAVLASPVFAFLATSRGASLIDTLARWSRWPGSTLLFATPITLLALPFFAISSPTAMYDWASFAMYGGIFLLGYVIFSDERLVAAVRRDALPAAVTVVLSIAGNALITGFMPVVFAGGAHRYDATYVLVVNQLATANCALALALLGLGMRAKFMQRPLPSFAATTSMATYVLHFGIVIAISALVVQLTLDVWTKIALNVALGVGFSVLAAAVAVRLAGIARSLPERRRAGSQLGFRFAPAGGQATEPLQQSPSPALAHGTNAL